MLFYTYLISSVFFLQAQAQLSTLCPKGSVSVTCSGTTSCTKLVSSKSIDGSLSSNMKIVSSCGLEQCPPEFPIYIGNNQCGSCSSLKPYVYGNTCVSSCPSAAMWNYNQVCVSSCPSGTYYYENKCVTSCPLFRHNERCVSSCPRGTLISAPNCFDV